jgi:flagellar biosynthesis protein FlhF
MRLKTYFVDTLEEALSQARGELGDEAMLVHSKRTSSEAEHLGRYEVVFAAPQNAKPPQPLPVSPPAPPTVAPRKPPARSEPAVADMRYRSSQEAQQAKIRRELKALSKMMDSPPHGEMSRSEEIRSTLDELYGYLAEREVRGKHIEKIINKVGLQLMRGSLTLRGWAPETLLEQALVDPLHNFCRQEPEKCRGIALLGPPGAGKTTTLAKLAVQSGLACGRAVRVLDLDNQRIGGGEHLQTICDLLGVRYQQVAGPETLPEILAEVRNEEFILIDTPGLTIEDSTELAVMGLGLGLAECMAFERHLILPATLRNAEMIRYWAAYRICHPTHLLFSRLDESLCFGPVWSLAVETQLPISWMSTGRKIPDCIIEATARTVSGLVHRGYAPLSEQYPTQTPAPNVKAGAHAYLGTQDTPRSFASQ